MEYWNIFITWLLLLLLKFRTSPWTAHPLKPTSWGSRPHLENVNKNYTCQVSWTSLPHVVQAALISVLPWKGHFHCHLRRKLLKTKNKEKIFESIVFVFSFLTSITHLLSCMKKKYAPIGRLGALGSFFFLPDLSSVWTIRIKTKPLLFVHIPHPLHH